MRLVQQWATSLIISFNKSLVLKKKELKKHVLHAMPKNLLHFQEKAMLSGCTHSHTHIFSASGIKLANRGFLILCSQYTGMNVP